MSSEVLPPDEADRLSAVRRYDILDTPPDGTFDRITALAARLFDVPISIVSIVDADRIWFKSHHGLDVEEIDREPGLCASAILQDGPWLVTDAARDPRTLANPLVAGEFGLRFYAGVPLTTSDGYNLGTLCVIDQEPREISESEVATLADLANVVVDELELRLSARRTVELEARMRHQAEEMARSLQDTLLPARLPDIEGFEVAARYHVAQRDRVGGDFYDIIPVGSDACTAVVGDACGKGTAAAAVMGSARWALRAAIVDDTRPGANLERLNDVIASAGVAADRYVTVSLAHLRRHDDGASVTVALGGHPPPLLLRSTGEVERLGTPAPIVGWQQGASYPETEHVARPGDVLVMYTDGLLEAVCGRDAPDDARLEEVLRPLAGAAIGEIEVTLDAAAGDARCDDVAFLLVRVT